MVRGVLKEDPFIEPVYGCLGVYKFSPFAGGGQEYGIFFSYYFFSVFHTGGVTD